MQVETPKAKKTKRNAVARKPVEEIYAELHLDLNEFQLAAVEHKEGPAAVAGTPGSGKTRVLITRLLKLYRDGVDPSRICATTFSKAAASVIESRLKILGAPDELRVGTLHSVGLEIIRSAGMQFGGHFNVDGGSKLHFVLKDILSRELRSEEEIDIRELEEWISMAKVNMLPVREGYGDALADPVEADLKAFARKYFDAFKASIAMQAYHLFEAKRVQMCLLSFSDMLLGACLALRNDVFRRMWAGKFDHVLLDEAHDSNMAQIEIVRALSNEHSNLMLFHSVSQSIYAWRGAKPQYLLDWTKNFALYQLPLGYRCNQRISDAASDLVGDADWNVEGRIIPMRDHDPPKDAIRFVSCEHQRQEAALIADEIQTAHRDKDLPYASYAILYRTTALLLEPELALLRKKIPYRVLAGSNFFGRKEVLDLLGYLRVASLRDPAEIHAARITNAPFRFISKSLIEQAQQMAKASKIAYLDAITRVSMRENQRSRVEGLLRIIKVTNGKIVHGIAPSEVLEYIVKATGYIRWLEKSEGTGGPNSEAPKAAYVHELIRFAQSYATTKEMLDAVDDLNSRLRSARRSKKSDYVTLSTLHSAKGLEFDRVYIVGCADGLMPHYLNAEKDEERRLLYVGMTRARDYCILTWPRKVTTPHGIIQAFSSPLFQRMRKYQNSKEGE